MNSFTRHCWRSKKGTTMDDSAQSLNDEGRQIWDQKAAFWDQLHGDEGNQFHRKLVEPPVMRLLGLGPGASVLDVACGNGTLARRMAALGAAVTAVDFSAALIERARSRGQTSGEAIQYGVVDATDEDALVALGRFDAVTCTMALMDMPLIAPLYRAVRRILQPGGRFVFALPHPVFNSAPFTLSIERELFDGTMRIRHSVKLDAYLDVPPIKSEGAPGDATPHSYYHRPLQMLLGEAFAAGLVLDGLEDSSYAAEDAEPERPLAYSNFPQFPPVLAARLRPLA